MLSMVCTYMHPAKENNDTAGLTVKPRDKERNYAGPRHCMRQECVRHDVCNKKGIAGGGKPKYVHDFITK